MVEIKEINKNMISAHGVKISVGCRITAARKMFLEEEARKKGAKSFSEFLESVLSDYGKEKPDATNHLKNENEALKKELSVITGNNAALIKELSGITGNSEALKKELSGITGNEDLQKIFTAYKGKSLLYQMPSGEKRSIEVKNISDVVKALVETVFDKN